MRRRLTVALMAALGLAIAGCGGVEELKLEAGLIRQELSMVTSEFDELVEDLRVAEAAGDPVAGDIAEAIEGFNDRLDVVEPYLEQLDDTIANSEDSADLGIGLLEFGLGLAGLGGVGGIVGDRLRRAKEARERRVMLNALTQGETAADRRTLAMLPPDIAEALRTNGREHD